MKPLLRAALLCALLFSSLSWPETTRAQETRKDVIKLSAEQERLYELLLLQLEHQQIRVSSSKSNESIAQTLLTYEQIVTLRCMPQLRRTLTHSGAPEDPHCRKYLDTLLKLYPESAIGLCAEHGTESESCKVGFQQQYILPYSYKKKIKKESESSEGIENFDLDSKLYSIHTEDTLRQLKSKIRAKRKALTKLTQSVYSPEYLKEWLEIDSLYSKALGVACKKVYIQLIEQEPPGKFRANYNEGNLSKDPLHKLLLNMEEDREKRGKEEKKIGKRSKQLREHRKKKDFDPFSIDSEPVEEKTEDAITWHRARYLSPDCFELIADSREFDPEMGTAICHKESLYSPRCIEAARQRQNKLRRLTKQANQTKSTPGKTNDRPTGFDTF